MIQTADDTATMVLSGKSIPLSDYGLVVVQMDGLVRSLANQYAEVPVPGWELGSVSDSQSEGQFRRIHTVARGQWTSEPEHRAVATVVRAYEELGEAIQRKEPLKRFSHEVVQHALTIVGTINGHIQSVTFETARQDSEITANPYMDELPTMAAMPVTGMSYGSVRGRIETIARRRGLRFTLYEYGDDLAVSCYIDSGLEPKLVDAWGKIVVVEGMVKRDATGRPSSIKQVSDIVILPESDQWNYRAARGALQWRGGAGAIQEAMRKLRDG